MAFLPASLVPGMVAVQVCFAWCEGGRREGGSGGGSCVLVGRIPYGKYKSAGPCVDIGTPSRVPHYSPYRGSGHRLPAAAARRWRQRAQGCVVARAPLAAPRWRMMLPHSWFTVCMISLEWRVGLSEMESCWRPIQKKHTYELAMFHVMHRDCRSPNRLGCIYGSNDDWRTSMLLKSGISRAHGAPSMLAPYSIYKQDDPPSVFYGSARNTFSKAG